METTRDQINYPLGATLEFMSELWALSHSLESASKRLQARLGITSPQRIALRIIGKYPGITPGHLAKVLHVHAGTVSAVLRRLEAKKLVERRAHGRDGRRVALGLTAAGRELDLPDPASVEGSVSRVLEKFSPEGLQIVRQFLGQLTNELEIPIPP